MADLILIKHSEVVVDSAVPPKEWRLSDAGRRLCRPLADALRMHEPAVIVSSEEPKAVETADLVGQHLRIEARTAADLDEHRRPFVDTPQEFERQIQRFFTEPDERVFGEESAAEALARFTAAVEAVLAAETGRNVAIVTHGTVIALYAAPMFGVGTGALWQRLQMPSFVVVDRAAKRGLRVVDEIE